MASGCEDREKRYIGRLGINFPLTYENRKKFNAVWHIFQTALKLFTIYSHSIVAGGFEDIS